MTYHPMLFSAPMVRALLDGRKTQTRRLLKSQPELGFTWHVFSDGAAKFRNPHTGYRHDIPVPIQPGDRIWVREAHAIHSDWNRHDGYVTYIADARCWHTGPNTGDIPDDNLASWFRVIDRSADGGHKKIGRPSIHMPRWASRLTLTVTDVRAQRLQEISEEDAKAEGVERDTDGWFDYLWPETQCCTKARDSFKTLWNSINGPEAWDANPWVAAYSFTVEQRNIDQ